MFPISRNPFYFQVYLFMLDSLLLLAHFYNCADYFFKYFEHSCLIFCNWQFWQLKSAGSKSVVHFFQLILMGRLTFQYAEWSWLWNDSLISSRILEDFLQRLLLLLLFTWAVPGCFFKLATRPRPPEQGSISDTGLQGNSASCFFAPTPLVIVFVGRGFLETSPPIKRPEMPEKMCPREPPYRAEIRLR